MVLRKEKAIANVTDTDHLRGVLKNRFLESAIPLRGLGADWGQCPPPHSPPLSRSRQRSHSGPGYSDCIIICFKLGTKWNHAKLGLGGKYTLFVGRMRIVLWAREKCSESSSWRPVSHCDYYTALDRARHNHNNKRDLNTKQKSLGGEERPGRC